MSFPHCFLHFGGSGSGEGGRGTVNTVYFLLIQQHFSIHISTVYSLQCTVQLHTVPTILLFYCSTVYSTFKVTEKTITLILSAYGQNKKIDIIYVGYFYRAILITIHTYRNGMIVQSLICQKLSKSTVQDFEIFLMLLVSYITYTNCRFLGQGRFLSMYNLYQRIYSYISDRRDSTGHRLTKM